MTSAAATRLSSHAVLATHALIAYATLAYHVYHQRGSTFKWTSDRYGTSTAGSEVPSLNNFSANIKN
jgi:hypothetical protein